MVGTQKITFLSTTYIWGFPGGSDGKVSAYNVGDPGSIPGLGRSSGKGNGNPLQYSCLENPMDGRRSVVGYSPWGHKESDTTEHFTSTSTCLGHKGSQSPKTNAQKKENTGRA